MISAKISGLEKLRALPGKISTSLKSSASLAPIRQDAARIVSDSNRRSFNNERAPDGSRWPPRATPKRGRKIVNTKPLLVASGRFKAALLSPTTRVDNLGQRLTVSYDGGISDLLQFHNFGTRRGLPPRPVGLQLDARAQEEISAIAFKRISEAFSKNLK